MIHGVFALLLLFTLPIYVIVVFFFSPVITAFLKLLNRHIWFDKLGKTTKNHKRQQ